MQPQLLRSCGTGLAVVAALSVLFHSNAASAADTDLSQQHHAVNAVLGELYYSNSLWYNVQQHSTTIERSTSSLPVHACAQHCMCSGADHPTTGRECHCTTVDLGSHQRIDTLLLSADLAAGGEEDFWGNVGAYIRFFFTVLLGTANVASQPFRKVSHAAAHSPCCLDAMSAAGLSHQHADMHACHHWSAFPILQHAAAKVICAPFTAGSKAACDSDCLGGWERCAVRLHGDHCEDHARTWRQRL